MAEQSENLRHTPLYDLNVQLGGRMVPFAGYAMPVQFPDGIIKEHNHARDAAGLFDVSHMGQAILEGSNGHDPAVALETLLANDIQALAPGRTRYSQLLNEQGGIMDDLMVTRRADGPGLFLVVNAACKDADLAHIEKRLDGKASLTRIEDRALLALQGPAAAAVLARFAPDCGALVFLEQRAMEVAGVPCLVGRLGYTGEDGYEISVPEAEAEGLARRLLGEPEVKPIGLGARDSLRLEAGYCLYGHDIDTTTTPVEADLAWSISKRRRQEGGFPGDKIILQQFADGPQRKRIGLQPEGRSPIREGTPLADSSGQEVGIVTSGGFSPSCQGPVAMGYLPPALATPGTEVSAIVRGKAVPCRVVTLPFVPSRTVSTKK
ncbi:glycine cleavage system aminomethyltransferase GcvT [Limibacillus halophilus]|uniref:aminomethyltransferase n=1 Tax=Limibacillus halophilus TaxID=1579333 RepID=A0A839ST10_9PROT|nr:glycine cleavage system aminomethyltransferase GcvT [Limibacillus halophilus]MBB3065941.1 aminomethyltransferase [Limibacillus halophilus]